MKKLNNKEVVPPALMREIRSIAMLALYLALSAV